MKKLRFGVSLIEVMIAAAVLSVGVLPVLTLLLSSGQTVRSVGFHMMASELAANKLDNILSLPYDEAYDLARDLEINSRHDAIAEMSDILDSLTGAVDTDAMRQDIALSFRNLSYAVYTHAKENQFLVSVTVFFSTTTDNEQHMTFEAIKYREGGR